MGSGYHDTPTGVVVVVVVGTISTEDRTTAWVQHKLINK